MNVDLVAPATTDMLPPATCVAGTIRIDDADAEVFVATGDRSKKAVMTVQDGMPLSREVCERSMRRGQERRHGVKAWRLSVGAVASR